MKVRYKRDDAKEELTEEDLEKPVAISLTETPTLWLLDIIGTAVSLESDEAENIKERNEAYTTVSGEKGREGLGRDRRGMGDGVRQGEYGILMQYRSLHSVNNSKMSASLKS